MRGTEDAGVKDTESLPLGSSRASGGNRSSTDYHRMAVRRKQSQVTGARLFWTRWSGKVSWPRPRLSRDLNEACDTYVEEHDR